MIYLAVVPGQPSSFEKPEDHCSRVGHIVQEQSPTSSSQAYSGRVLRRVVDYSKIKSWLYYCQLRHSESCGEIGTLVDGLKLIDCDTRTIIPANYSHAYPALSYV